MMHRRSFLLLLVALISVGCRSHDYFVRSRDYDIGKTVWQAGVPDPVRIEPIDDKTSRYIYEYKDKNSECRFAYTVDNDTKRILSWKFLSNPDHCYTETTFID